MNQLNESDVELEKRLIIIDDETSLLQVLQDYLQTFGLKIFAYEEIPDLENELKEIRPHAILLDILMPRVSGVEILKRVKEIDGQIPVIMMTGYADEDKRIEALRSGAYALLTKPFKNFEELYHTVNNAMNHYLASLKAQRLSLDIEERYRREKINIVELEFLKSLQRMIGETDEAPFVLKNVHALLKSFLDFEYFGALLLLDDEVNVEVYPNQEQKGAILQSIASTLLKNISLQSAGNQRNKLTIQGSSETVPMNDTAELQSSVIELSTGNKIYGYTGVFREKPFSVEEELLFKRFCSHIALTLEKIRLFKEVKMLSIHDSLTGFYNHAQAMQELEMEIERAKRYGIAFSLIMLDIDDFKRVNDTYGHLAGDYVLKTVSQLIGKNLRTIDVIGRYGGEEFIVILPETNSEKADIAAERLRKAVETGHLSYDDNNIELTISVGVATYEDGMDVLSLIKRADDNLYKAKIRGKNRICHE